MTDKTVDIKKLIPLRRYIVVTSVGAFEGKYMGKCNYRNTYPDGEVVTDVHYVFDFGFFYDLGQADDIVVYERCGEK